MKKADDVSAHQAEAGGQGGSFDPPAEDADEKPVQHNICQRHAHVHSHAVVDPPTDPQVIVHGEKVHDKDGEGRIDTHVLHCQVSHFPGGPQQLHKRVGKQPGQCPHYKSRDEDQKAGSGKDAPCHFSVLFSKPDGNLDRRTNGYHVREGKAHHDQRHNQIDGSQRLSADVVAHKDPVSDGVQRYHSHTDHVGDGAPEEESGGRHPVKHPVMAVLYAGSMSICLQCSMRICFHRWLFSSTRNGKL